MSIVVGLLLHAILFGVLLGLTEVHWLWALDISGLVVWLGVLVIDSDIFN